LSSYLTVNRVALQYSDRYLRAVYRNSYYLLWDI